MSATGCWNCGSSSHHRRDCDVDVDKDSAAQTKREAMLDHRAGRKTQAERTKSTQKFQIRTSPPAHASLLKRHLEIALQQIYNSEVLIAEVGPPQSSDTTSQLQRLTAGESLLREQFVVMREVVAHTKHYLRSMPDWDEQDRFLKADVDHMDEIRPKLMANFSRIIADLREIERLMLMFLTEFEKTAELLDRGEAIIGERYPSVEKLDTVAELVAEANQHHARSKDFASKIHKLASDFDMEGVDAMDDRLIALKSRRRVIMNARLTELEENSLCKICISNPREIALQCGHQLCNECVAKIRRTNNLCPSCRRLMVVAVRLF